MENWKTTLFATDLSNFLSLMDRYEVPIERKELVNLENILSYQEDFSVSVDDIVINIDKKISGTLPSEIKHICVFFSHKLNIDNTKDFENQDVINEYSFQINIKAYTKAMDKEYCYSWHLDKNIESETPKFTHPYYHFQAGGNNLEDMDTGDLIILGAPRIPHPPMDLFLGFHFIINNFLSTKDYPNVKKLMEDYDYQVIIMNSQKRMWNPYFNSFHSDCKHLDYNFVNVFPLYIHSA